MQTQLDTGRELLAQDLEFERIKAKPLVQTCLEKLLDQQDS